MDSLVIFASNHRFDMCKTLICDLRLALFVVLCPDCSDLACDRGIYYIFRFMSCKNCVYLRVNVVLIVFNCMGHLSGVISGDGYLHYQN